MFCRALCLATGQWAQNNFGAVSALVLNDNNISDKRYVNERFVSYTGAGKSKTRFIKHFLRHILTNRYDLIIFGHVSLCPFALLAKLLNRRGRTAVITYGIEVWRPLRKIQRAALTRADVVLAISEYTKSELIRHNALPAEKIKIFPCTLDPFWRMGTPSAEAERQPPVILSVTRMSKEDRYKGIDSVIRSIPAIVREVGPVEYRIVGQGNDVPRLRALAAGLGVARHVHFMGAVSDEELQEQYRHCSLFVMPSRKEGFGIVFLEAMAYAKAVVGGAHGGTPSVVTDTETGLLVDTSDVAGIAHSVIQLLGDADMRRKLGRAGHQRLKDQFVFERFEHNLSEVFRSL